MNEHLTTVAAKIEFYQAETLKQIIALCVFCLNRLGWEGASDKQTVSEGDTRTQRERDNGHNK